MANEIISYLEMCQREGCNLQRGMNFNLGGRHSVILMSVQPNAPYHDRFEEGGTVFIYEGHDEPRSPGIPDPKIVDQPEHTPLGALTQNGKFHRAAQATKAGKRELERVRVYEKIRAGIWSYNGIFHLVDSWQEKIGGRSVFDFKLVAVAGEEEVYASPALQLERRRIIPTTIKIEVWKRDGGKCIECGATDELHFDHDLPFAKGRTSITAENVQLLCARNNLSKNDKIL